MAATILVVDDDESMRDLLRLHLTAAGYDVQVAEDAIAAGYMVLRSPPDLIISDVNIQHIARHLARRLAFGERIEGDRCVAHGLHHLVALLLAELVAFEILLLRALRRRRRRRVGVVHAPLLVDPAVLLRPSRAGREHRE